MTLLSRIAFERCDEAGPDVVQAEQIERVVLDLMRFEIEAAEVLREIGPRRGPSEIAARLELERANEAALRTALVMQDDAPVAAHLRSALGRAGLHIPEGCDDWRRLARWAARGLLEVCAENLRREQGIYLADRRLETVFACASPAPASALPPRPFWEPAPHPVPMMAGSTATTPLVQPDAGTKTPPASAFRLDLLAVAPETAGAPPVQEATDATPSLGRVMRPHEPAAPVENVRAAECPTISEGFSMYCARRAKENPKWSKTSLPNALSLEKLMTGHFGDRPINSLPHDELKEFFQLVEKLPADHHRNCNDRRSVLEILDALEDKETEERFAAEEEARAQGLSERMVEEKGLEKIARRLAPATVLRHMRTAQAMLELFVPRHLATNPMKGVVWTKKEEKARKELYAEGGRREWGDDRLKKLLVTPIFVQRLTDPGDPLFWAPLIALLTGLRMEEILQLHVDDFETEDGVLFIRIQLRHNSTLKTMAARRKVPVHSELVRLGLPRLVALRRAQGETHLFPHLTRSEVTGRLSTNFSKKFTRYRQDHDVYFSQCDFHSFRTENHVRLKRAGVGYHERQVLLGHEINDTTDTHYDPAGLPMSAFQEFVNRVCIDLSGVRSPFEDQAQGAGSVIAFRARS